MGTLTSVAILLASLLSGASCARPEQRDALYTSAMSAQREFGTKEGDGAYCGIRSLQLLGNHAQEKDVMDRALAMCLEQKPTNGCRPLADLWLERNLTAEFSGSTTFCDLLRPLMTEAGLAEDKLAGSRRRGHRRRNYQRRRRSRRRTDRRRRQATCHGTQVRLTTENECCDITVEAYWKNTASVADTSTITSHYGYTKTVTDFDMEEAYESIETSASAGFEAYGISGSMSVGSASGSSVVKSTEITTAVGVNSEVSNVWSRKDGNFLYQWTWDTSFRGSSKCTKVPRATVVTPFIVQSSTVPRCLPDFSTDATYQSCEDGYTLPR